MGTAAEVDWFLHDMGRFFPEAADRFLGLLDVHERQNVLASYYQRLSSAEKAVCQPAAEAWASYETSVRPSVPPIGR